MKIIDHILQREEFVSAPPVLIDIGASGGLHAKWSRVAPYSYCIGFDPDSREMGFAEKETTTFRKLFIFNRVVTDLQQDEVDFYLTKSPFCSSSLHPENEKLGCWSFQRLFDVERTVKLKAMRVSDALHEAGISGIDWFKTDTQGTDLRLFRTLPDEIRQNVLLIELEPGILDGYQGEDKLSEVIGYMHQQGFFLSTMEVKGTQRISPEVVESFSGIDARVWKHCLMKSPGWAELSYLNPLQKGKYPKRSYLLAFVFALLEKQFGFALEIARSGYAATNDPYFNELHDEAMKLIHKNNLSWVRVFVRKAGRKLFSYV